MIFYRYITFLLLLLNLLLTAYLYKLYIGLSATLFYQSVMVKELFKNYDIFFSNLHAHGPFINFWYTLTASIFFRKQKMLPISEWHFQNSVQHFSGTSVQNEWLLSLNDILNSSNLSFFYQYPFFSRIYSLIAEFLSDYGIDLSPSLFFLMIALLVFSVIASILIYTDFSLIVISDHHLRLHQLETFIAEKLNNGKPLVFNRAKDWNPIKDLRSNSNEFYSDRTIADWLEEVRENRNKKSFTSPLENDYNKK